MISICVSGFKKGAREMKLFKAFMCFVCAAALCFVTVRFALWDKKPAADQKSGFIGDTPPKDWHLQMGQGKELKGELLVWKFVDAGNTCYLFMQVNRDMYVPAVSCFK
jgi:hypothetical protein